MRAYRKNNAEKMREYQRTYNQKWRIKNGYENEKRSKLKYPYKEKIRKIFQWNVRSGKIKKMPCEVCGNPNAQGHHEDYTKPLEVIWLCPLCHKEKHKMKPTSSEKKIEAEIIKKIKELNKLSEKHRKAIKIRNYTIIKMYPEHTLQEIGNKFGITRERVRQIIWIMKQKVG